MTDEIRYVQLVLTTSQVELLQGATQNAIALAGNEQEQEQLVSLDGFLRTVADHPSAFPIKTPELARSIKKRIARLKGPAQPVPNKRKRAQLRSQGGQKRTRAQKRAEAAIWNEAFQAAQEQLKEERASRFGITLPGRRGKRTDSDFRDIARP